MFIFCMSMTTGFNLALGRSLRSRCVSFATWNVRTLVENTGDDRRICRVRPNPKVCHLPSDGPHCVDRKLVNELKKLNVAVAGIQETKWFGQDVWNADGYTLLHSGRTLPRDGEPLLRNKGVGIVLDRHATVAWKNAGETWQAVSSRIVTARLQIAQRGCRRYGGTRPRWTGHRYLSLMSVYAPTAKAPPGIKEKFVVDFQRTLDSLPVGDVVLLLGDFNAHVGKWSSEDEVWREVRGSHGLGTCNEAGEQLLELCAINNLIILNTWFKKKPVHLGTWVHPATKQAYMIDFVIMKRDQLQLCADVRVYRSACCWTDHYLVKGKLMLRKQRNSVTCVPLAVHRLSSQEVRDRYQQSLE